LNREGLLGRRLHPERPLGFVEHQLHLLPIELVTAHSSHELLRLLSASADLLRAAELAHQGEQRDRAQVEHSRQLRPEPGEHAFEPIAVLLELLLVDLEHAKCRGKITLLGGGDRPWLARAIEVQLRDDRRRLRVMEAGDPVVDLGRVVRALRIHPVDR